MTQEQKEIYKEWKSLVNMTQSELKKFYDSEEGKEAGLSASKAKSLGIDSMTNDFHKVIKNKMAKGGLIEQDFYHVSNKEIKKVKPYFHIGSKNSAEKRSEDYNYGNDALYYKVKFVKQPKAKDVSDRLANLYASYYSGIDILKEATKEEMHSIKSIKRLGFNALKYKNEIEGDYSYLIINPELIKIENIMEKGGEVQEYFTIDFYNVSAHTDTSSDQKYGGYSYDDAKSDFDSIDYTDVSDVSGGYALLEKRTETYKFVGDLEDGETIDDYPIEDYYDDYSMYEFVSEGDFETIEEKTISPPNESSDELLKEVERYMNSKYGSYKYNVISVYDDEDNRVGCVQVRVADHSENVSNIDRYLKCDYSLSVVIANLDKTKGRFLTSVYERRSNEDEEYFSSDDSFEDIISFIEDWIEDKSEELRYVKMEKGGEVAAKSISEAYHKAKEDGSNPELVKAVEDLLQKNKPTISKEQTEPATQEEIDATAKALEGVDATFSADLSDSKLSVDERKQSAKKQIKDNGITNDASYALISRALEKVDGLSVNNIFDLAKRIAKLDNKPILVEHIAEAIQYEVGRVEGVKDTFSLSIEDVKDVLLNWSKDAEPANKTRMDEIGIVGKSYRDRINKLKAAKKQYETLNEQGKTLVKNFLNRFNDTILEDAKLNTDEYLQLLLDLTKSKDLVDVAENIQNAIRVIEDKESIELQKLPPVKEPLKNQENTEEALKRFSSQQLSEIPIYNRNAIVKMIDAQLKKSKQVLLNTVFPEIYDLPSKTSSIRLNEKGEVELLDKNQKKISGKKLTKEQFVDIALQIGNNQTRKDAYNISKAYHKAKADGSNPELVKAVESILSKETPTTETKIAEETPKSEPIAPKENIFEIHEKTKGAPKKDKVIEHTDSKEKATEIVYDHLTESPFYYNELDKMESKLESENEIHDAIKGLEMILPTLYGSEKSDMQDAISGLKILLGNKVKYEMGGAIESEEDEIMRSQFGSKQF